MWGGWLVENFGITIVPTEKKIRLDRLGNIIYYHFLLVRRRELVQVVHNLRIARIEGGLHVILSHLGLEQDVVYLMLCDESCTHVRYILQPYDNVLGKNREFVTAWRNLLKSWKEKVTRVMSAGPAGFYEQVVQIESFQRHIGRGRYRDLSIVLCNNMLTLHHDF